MSASVAKKQIVDGNVGVIKGLARTVYRVVRKLLPSSLTLWQVNLKGTRYLIWANEDIGKKIILTRSYESKEIAFLGRSLREGDVCFDVGGNIGFYALNFAKGVGASGKVFSFEPLKRNALLIQLAAEMNGLGNISVHNIAVSDAPGFVSMVIPEEDGAYAYIDKGKAKAQSNISCITVDDFVRDNSIEKVDVMKVDVEGAELQVLKGAAHLFREKEMRPRLVMIEIVDEYLRRFDSSEQDVFNFMKDVGYVPHIIDRNHHLLKYDRLSSERVFNIFFVSEDESKT